MPDAIHIHTDGSCLGNPGPGGYAAIIMGEKEIVATGAKPHTTNNRMELTAVIAGMKAFGAMLERGEAQDQSPIVLHTDSKYVSNAFNQDWIKSWQANNWRNSKRQPVANQDLWVELLELTHGRQISYQWVKAHSGNVMNERCDQLANEAAQEMAAGPQPTAFAPDHPETNTSDSPPEVPVEPESIQAQTQVRTQTQTQAQTQAQEALERTEIAMVSLEHAVTQLQEGHTQLALDNVEKAIRHLRSQTRILSPDS